MPHPTDLPPAPVPGGPAWQDDPYGWAPAGAVWDRPPTPPAPDPSAGGRGHRRFGVLAVAAALVAGAGAGAATAALLGRSTTVLPSTAAATFSTAGGTGATTQSIIAKVEPALVDIHTTGTSSSPSWAFGNGANPFGGSGGDTTTSEAAGTGMIIRSNGLILTNAHVLEGATTITVTYNGTTASHPATLVGEDAAKDIALIKVSGASNLPTVTLADSSAAVAGDQVLAIGNALDLQSGGFTASQGIISGLDRSISTDNNESLTGLLQTSAPISSGDSGGPLVDASGQVIGMDTASAASTSTNTASNVGFAIPANQITSLLSQLEQGSIGQTTVGSSGSSGSSGGYGYGSGYGSGAGGYVGYGSSIG